MALINPNNKNPQIKLHLITDNNKQPRQHGYPLISIDKKQENYLLITITIEKEDVTINKSDVLYKEELNIEKE